MGRIKHDAIICAASQDSDLLLARDKAIALGLPVSGFVPSFINGYCSFLIGPDGSKEGWESSDEGESNRAQWIAWTREIDLAVDWAHVSYGGDDPELAHLVDHNEHEEES
jgi:hypothetical protein